MTNLEYLRRVYGISQMDLAIKLKCHSSLISKLERGWQTKVNSVIQRRLAKFFGADWTIEKLLEKHKQSEIRPDEA